MDLMSIVRTPAYQEEQQMSANRLFIYSFIVPLSSFNPSIHLSSKVRVSYKSHTYRKLNLKTPLLLGRRLQLLKQRLHVPIAALLVLVVCQRGRFRRCGIMRLGLLGRHCVFGVCGFGERDAEVGRCRDGAAGWWCGEGLWLCDDEASCGGEKEWLGVAGCGAEERCAAAEGAEG